MSRHEFWSLAQTYVRKTMNDNKYGHQLFRNHFGCNIGVCVELWAMVVETDMLPEGTKCKHLLWALYFLKNYSTYPVMASIVKADDKTIRKYIKAREERLMLNIPSFLKTTCPQEVKFLPYQR